VISPRVPEIEAGWALFLDLDGTLLDIAPTPDAVRVPPGLIASLGGVGERLGGALAIVTGRARETVDRLLAPLTPPGGFGHGAELRDAEGRLGGAERMPTPPAGWAARLEREIAAWPGVMLERKPHGLALHYRAAPERAEAARAALEALLAGQGGDFALLPAHMAFEIRPRRATKARAVEALMRSPPFRGRRPVFVGDDVTDEAGMEAARRHGGLGLHVGRDFVGGPAEVRAWLARALARLPAGGAHVHA
jgi:trehalose 6-phosphate phosphatase